MAFQDLCILVLCIFAASWVYFSIFHNSRTPRTVRDLQQCREILKASTLSSRAAPNQRLVEVFNINNALTTTNWVYHDYWVREIRVRLNTQDEEWNTLATFASSNLCRTLLLNQVQGENERSVNLAQLVQSLVFRIVLQKFFHKVPQPGEVDVQFITSRINSLWLATKHHTSQSDANILDLKMELEGRLRTIFELPPTGKIAGKDNPLNTIIPAYESLWRVVLRCFLEVHFKENATTDQIDYARIFSRFMAHPNTSVFEAPFQDTDISIKHIVNESLRLYPPTRRIHRQLKDEVVKIDVEWLHRDPLSWGPDAQEFRPQRWEGVLKKDVKAKMAFLPFGLGELSCPARNFAPMLIGVLVGSLMGGVGEGWVLVGEGSDDVLEAKVLDGGREAYAGLRLRKSEV